MAKGSVPFYSFNAGIVSRYALARTDMTKLRLAGEVQTNLLPQILGPAIFRPGTAYEAGSTLGDLPARIVPFIFNTATRAKLELTTLKMRVVVDGVVLTRPSVIAQTVNGSFTTDIASWTAADEAGATSAWVAGGYLGLTGTGSNYAIRTQQVTVTAPYFNVEHALRIVVQRGPVYLKVGSTAGGAEYIAQSHLSTGEHSLALTPAGNFHISISANANVLRLVDAITVESAVPVELPTPWDATKMWLVRHAQSGDVLFCACDGLIQKRIERRSQRSWSIVDYAPNDGPFDFPNSTPITVTPSGVTGNITLTASKALFNANYVKALWRITHNGQTATKTMGAVGDNTDNLNEGNIRVVGVGAGDRTINIKIVGAFTGTLTLQKSIAEPTAWSDVKDYTAPTSDNYVSVGDNAIIYYRVYTTALTAGTPVVTITYDSSIQDGIARITGYTSPTVVSAEVVRTFGRATASANWAEGAWSADAGFPGSVTFHDGRLFWGWLDTLYGSVSDAYDSFDELRLGDSAPIIRSVATGGFEGIYSLLSLQRLIALTGGQEVSIRASSFDEPLSPTAFTARSSSNRGSANIQAVQIDGHGIFVQRNEKRIYAIINDAAAGDYTSVDLTRLCPEIASAGVVEMAVQRLPDTRLWFVLDDGTCAVLIYEPADDTIAWIKVETVAGDLFRSVMVLPGTEEDEVHFVVERIINGVTRRYHEKMALLSEARGASVSKNMDCHKVVSQTPSDTIPGLTHLIGRQVVVWSAGVPQITADAPKTVDGTGAITGLTPGVSNGVVGLIYTGQFKSAKLAYGLPGTALSQRKRLVELSLLMADVGLRGVKVGRSFTKLRGIPVKNPVNGQALSASTHVVSDYDFDETPFRGDWGTDERLCFEIKSPFPATFMGAVMGLAANDHSLVPQKEDA